MLIGDAAFPSEYQWCEICRKHQDGHCDGCGAAFLSGERRYRSQSVHYHPASIGGKEGTRAVQKELCVECYRADHRAVYPNHPVPDLPDRGVDPKFHAAQQAERKRRAAADALKRAQAAGLDVSELSELVSLGGRFLG